MRWLLLLFVASLLQAQEGLLERLQRSPRMPLAALESLQAELVPADLPDKAYWQSLVDYHQVWKQRGKDPDGAKARLEAAIARLEGRPDPESKALMGGCLDLMIGFNRAKAVFLAPRAARLIQEAQQEAPANPRPKVFWGIHCVFIPSLFGGGSARAVATLTEALREAEAEPTSNPFKAPRWGRIEAMVWLAQAQADEGQLEEARRTVDRAVALDPGYPFAQALRKELR